MRGAYLMSMALLALAMAESEIKDHERACPEGFFYAGEADYEDLDLTRSQVWEKGPKSPIYSCYQFIEDSLSFAGGSIKCNDLKGQLVSVNDVLESDIIISTLFTDNFSDEMESNLTTYTETEPVWTSGINLGADAWTWLGTDEAIEDEIVETLNINTSASSAANCITMRWRKEQNSTVVVYSTASCTELYTNALCEVKVYTQYWYVWAYANWLQILFFFTMGVLLLSTCCMFQALFLRRSSTVTRRPVLHAAPPPYTPTPSPVYSDPTPSKVTKYTQKGKDILAKVTIFKSNSDDKVKLHDTNA